MRPIHSFSVMLGVLACAAPSHADNLCTVLAAVRADAPKNFASIVDKTKPDGEHSYASKQTPAGATSATVSFSSGSVEQATWEARWVASKGTNAERLAALNKRVAQCPFAKDLVGDGKPHATERDAPPSAIDWQDPKAGTGVTFELLAEGKEGSSIVITVTPKK